MEKLRFIIQKLSCEAFCTRASLSFSQFNSGATGQGQALRCSSRPFDHQPYCRAMRAILLIREIFPATLRSRVICETFCNDSMQPVRTRSTDLPPTRKVLHRQVFSSSRNPTCWDASRSIRLVLPKARPIAEGRKATPCVLIYRSNGIYSGCPAI